MKGVHVQQTMASALLVKVHVTTELLVYGNGVPIQQTRGLIHIHSCVENRLKVCLMEDRQKEDHLIETCLEDHHLIHMLDFMDGKHLIHIYSHYEKSRSLKPHYLATKTQKKLICNYPLGITTNV
jgi:hypothetical protein